MKIPYLWMAAALSGTCLTSCNFLVSAIPLPDDRHLKNAPVSGRFSNEVTLIAVAPHTFLFVQPDDPEKRFSFTTHAEEYLPDKGRFRKRSWRIEPETMLTSGSSVPRLLWGVDGLGPMDFTKSAIIHDWLFEAHHRWQIAANAHELEIMAKYKDYAEIPAKLSPGTASTPELTIDDAADIMVEALKKEMRYNEYCIQALDRALASPEVANHTANAADGLKDLRKSFSIGRENPRKVKEYSFAIRTPFAKRVWKPRGKKENIQQSPHNSTVEVIRVLARNGSLDLAVKAGTITKDTERKLRELVKEKDARDAKIMRAEHKKAQQEPAAAAAPSPFAVLRKTPLSPPAGSISIGAVHDKRIRPDVQPIIDEIAASMNGSSRSAHQVSKLPPTTEVRFYHYPEDQSEAEKILEQLRKKGIQGRISFVPDSSQRRGSYQIAFGRDSGG